MDIVSYSIGKPFREERYISSHDWVMPRITPHSFDVVITLKNITIEERRCVSCTVYYVSYNRGVIDDEYLELKRPGIIIETLNDLYDNLYRGDTSLMKQIANGEHSIIRLRDIDERWNTEWDIYV